MPLNVLIKIIKTCKFDLTHTRSGVRLQTSYNTIRRVIFLNHDLTKKIHIYCHLSSASIELKTYLFKSDRCYFFMRLVEIIFKYSVVFHTIVHNR